MKNQSISVTKNDRGNCVKRLGRALGESSLSRVVKSHTGSDAAALERWRGISSHLALVNVDVNATLLSQGAEHRRPDQQIGESVSVQVDRTHTRSIVRAQLTKTNK